MTDFASNPTYVAPVAPPYLGAPNKIAMTAADRANGFVPGQPIGAENLNYELNALTSDTAALAAADATNLANLTTLIKQQVEGAALCNYTVATSGTTNGLNDVLWDTRNSQFLAVGAAGTIITSAQGREWTTRTSGVASSLNGVAGNATTLVVVGAGGIIRTSPNGITWTAQTSGIVTDLSDVWWQASLSLFIAVGASGVILTSPDGVIWTSRTSGLAVQIFVVGGSSTLLVAGASSGGIITSSDGITWTVRTSGTTNGFGGFAFKDGLYVLCAAGGTIVTSPDGITWTSRTSGTTQLLRGLIATQYHFLAVGNNGAAQISRDGVNWYFADGLSTQIFSEPAWNGRVMLICGFSGLVVCSQRLLNL